MSEDDRHSLREGDVLVLGKVVIGSKQDPRPLKSKQKAFPELPPNWVAEPFVKILIVKTWRRPGATFSLTPKDSRGGVDSADQ